MKIQISKSVLIVCMMLTVTITACGAIAPAATATALPSATATNTELPTFTPTITLTPTKTPTPTATPNLVATQQYDDFIAMVQKIYEAGQISTLEGTYSKLDDYSDELAMRYGYSWSPTGKSAKNFIVRADFDWEVANQKNNSGCGYQFRREDPAAENHFGEDYYLVALDGLNGVILAYHAPNYVYKAPVVNKLEKPEMGSNPYHAEFTLVVNDAAVYTYVNGNLFTEHRLRSNWLMVTGEISPMVLTGAETDFGTRCKITNAELWVIEP